MDAVYRLYVVPRPDAPPDGSSVHVDADESPAFPEKKNPHVHVARGTLYVQPGDVVVVSRATGDPVAVLTPDEGSAWLSAGAGSV